MKRFLRIAALLLTLLTLATLPRPSSAGSSADPGQYIVDQISSLSSQYWARVAGRDTALPPNRNGHDEFAAQWTREILASLHGLPVGVYRQQFRTPGFPGLPASRPGVNVIVSVPSRERS